MTDRKEYIERDSIVKAVVIQQDKERKDWMEHLQQLRGTKDYSSREIAVDNWLKGYNESVQYLVAKIEEMTAADVVEVVRCGECKHNERGDCVHSNNVSHSYDCDWNCYDHHLSVSEEHFCSYGERKEGCNNEQTLHRH